MKNEQNEKFHITATIGQPAYGSFSFVGNSMTYFQMNELSQNMAKRNALSNIVSFYMRMNESCGGVIVFNPKIGCLPYLLGSDNEPVFLNKFVEVIDEYIDYGILKKEFPNLSYGQISNGISFLRKLAQFNIRDINIDDLEDAELEASPEFQVMIEQSLADREETLVSSVK